jgi:hypothetical protein
LQAIVKLVRPDLLVMKEQVFMESLCLPVKQAIGVGQAALPLSKINAMQELTIVGLD